MNPLLKKEIRLLLPSFLIGCVLTFSNWLLPWKNTGAISDLLSLLPMVVCPAVTVMIALDSFGGEVSSGTFAMLLAQPISRLKIWQTKISLLAVALLVVGVLWYVSIFCTALFTVTSSDNAIDLYNLFVCAVMFAMVVFSGGLWTVLLLRQVAAAFWFTLLVPGVIMVIIVGLLANHSGEFVTGMTVSVLGLYSLAGFFFARWLFMRAQDVQWSGGTIVMPEMRGLPAWLSRSSMKRIFRPRAALWQKEIQLHQSQFVMAFALLLLHLGVIATRTLGHFRKNSSTEFILEAFWALWLVMPMLVGCAAVAEERKIGTLEGQLCLPVKQRTQFAIKFLVALFLSIFLGAIMPLLLEGTRILPNVHSHFYGLRADIFTKIDAGQTLSTAQAFFWNCLGELNLFLPLLTLAGIAATFGVISFYVSSLTRNTLQTLAPAVLGILLAFFMFVTIAQMRELFDMGFLWRGPLSYFVGVPVTVLTLLVLAFWNFQHVRTGWNMWRRNFFMFALALVFSVAATSAIYHRAWEKLTPFEPAHGAARLSPSNPASLSAQWNEISVRLPDGKIWQANFMASPAVFNPLALMLGNVKVTMDEGGFINGSNWVSVIRGLWFQQAGIKTDGTLWVSAKPARPGLRERSGREMPKLENLSQFGSETNWSSIIYGGASMLLLKNDGTLWRWGATNFDLKHYQWPGLQSFTPYRLGTESNWAEIYRNNYPIFLRKTDGSLWTWNQDWNTNGQVLLQLEPGFTLQSVKNLGREKFRSVALVSHGLQYDVGVRSDGTFRIWAEQHMVWDKSRHYGSYEWFPTDLQIGDGTNWIAVASDGDKIVTLKNDGSLWLWNFHHDNRSGWDTEVGEREMLKIKPVRLGTHSDWIAISGGYGNVNALAADGSLWFWPLESAEDMGGRSTQFFDGLFDNNGNSHFKPLLDISRKPQLLGNVFGKAD